MEITRFTDLADAAKKAKVKTTVAVVEAQDENTIESVVRAAGDGIMHPILIGDARKIGELLARFGADPMGFDILPSGGAGESLKHAVDMIHHGEAAALMKGHIDTSEFMKAVIDRENDLLTGSRLSLAGIFETPNYHKIFAVSDMVVNAYPDFECKRVIIENAVAMLSAIGIKRPKVAALTAVEKINAKMPETIEADSLKKLGQNGIIKNCIIEGPISFDLATSPEAAIAKGYNSPVAGDADLLIVPDIAAGNILAKCLTGMAGAQTAGMILGAKIPIILTSRSARASDKYYSIALAACVGSLGCAVVDD